MSSFLLLPHSSPREPLQSKQKLHEQCNVFFVFSYPGKEFVKHHHVLRLSANAVVLVLTTENLQRLRGEQVPHLKSAELETAVVIVFTFSLCSVG